jgi:hypothetical protein
VPPPNHPVAVDDVAVTNEGGEVDIDVALNDTNATSALVTSPPSAGLVTQLSATLLRFTPPTDWFGTTTFVYELDNGTGVTDTATVTVTVNPLPDAPVANDDTATVDEDITVTGITVLANDTDGDGDTLTITGVSSTDGTPTTDGTTIDYTPAPNSNGAHTITYTIDDGTGLMDTATVSVTVNPLPDAPVANDDIGGGYSTTTGVAFTTANVTTNDTDVDSPIDSTSVTVISTTTTGVLTNNADGTFDYAPNASYSGTDSFTYEITDAGGLTSNTATATIDIATGSTSGLVVSEFSNVGAGPAGDFIELYNGTTGAIDIEGWTLVIADDAAITQTIPLTGTETLIPPGGHYLIATSGARDQSMSPLDDSVAIRVRDGGVIHDEVGTRARNNAGSVPAALWSEGTGLPPLVDSIGSGASWERKAGRSNGNCVDSDNNSADFTKNYYTRQANAQNSWDADTPCGTPTPPTPPTTLVISEWRTDGPNGDDDEFVEIFNPTNAPISLAGYELREFGGGSKYIYPAVVLAPGQHYLVDRASFPGPSDDSFPGFTNGESVELRYIPTLTTVDVGLVGVGRSALPRLDGRIDQTYERRFDGCMDTDIWVDDFIHQSEPTPETYTDPPTPC